MLLVHKGLEAGMGVREGQELGERRRGMKGCEVMRMKREMKRHNMTRHKMARHKMTRHKMTWHKMTWHRDLICGMVTCGGARAVASGGAGCYIE